jgi:hypothetical protein
MWMVLTILFETVLGRYVLGKPWSQVLRDYDLLEGRVWGLFVLWLGLAQYVFYRFRA